MSSVPKETAQARPVPPSDVAPPTRVDTLPQQASTQPGDGCNVHTDNTDEVLGKTQKVPFKEQMIGVAQKTRGTLLNKPDLKEHGEAILDGRTTHEKDRNQ